MKRLLLQIKNKTINVYTVTDKYLTVCNENMYAVSFQKDFCNYIDKAPYLSILLDSAICIFDFNQISHCQTLKTDGEWIWSADLNHYTEKHSFLWPEAFAFHLKNKSFHINYLSEDYLEELGKKIFSTNIDDFDIESMFNFKKHLDYDYDINYFVL